MAPTDDVSPTTRAAAVRADAPALIRAAAGLAHRDDVRTTLYEVPRLRLAHRDRRKMVHFYRLVDALGRDVFAIAAPESLDSRPDGPAAFAAALSDLALGDVLTLTGYAAYRNGWSATIVVTSFALEARWALEHPGATFIAAAAPLHGNVLLQCPHSHAQRIAAYCASGALAVRCTPAGLSEPPWEGKGLDRCVALACERPCELALAAVRDPFLSSVVGRVLIAPERTVGLDAAMGEIARALERAGVRAARLITHPRALAERLTDAVEAAGVRLEPKRGRHTHVVALAWANGPLAWGVEPAEAYGFKDLDSFLADAATSRAYYKLREALVMHFGAAAAAASRAPSPAPAPAPPAEGAGRAVAPPLLRGLRAVDVGAAPGGWTSCLIEHGAAHVTAVDPAELDAQVLVLPGVAHMRMRAEEAAAAMLARGERFELLVCDMNLPPDDVVRLVQSMAPAVRPGGYLVLTLKRTMRNGVEWAAATSDAERRLAACWRDVRLVHLFANTNMERTILARRRERERAAPPPLAAGGGVALCALAIGALALALARVVARARRG
ncbi:hypothetical protein KFE25_001300 [Diacronema lutheri]|uniref:Ribosomal RNA methyltransferase FtsJ domain-containing protein n=1 Tax=Diacronema lutheri TaxID=2081491 RepID=A0A8J5XDG9_DIALT|nr:hypothetical protein KFE25_001300 [Diacronema lutheri]